MAIARFNLWLITVYHFLSVLRYGGTDIRSNRKSKRFCYEQAPFAVLVLDSYARVSVRSYRSNTRLKAYYFVMNNTLLDGKLTKHFS